MTQYDASPESKKDIGDTGTEDRGEGITARLAKAELTPAERKVVDFCLSIPEHQLAAMTSAEIAKMAGTSRSTVERVTRRLSFKGPKAMVFALARHSLGGVEEGDLDPTISASDEMGTVARKVLLSASVRARKFSDMLSSDGQLDTLIEWLDKAESIMVFGAGTSSTVANDLHHRLLRLGMNVKYAEDTHTQYAIAALMKPDDVGILYSYSGRTASTVRTAEIARANGPKLVAVTGQLRSPLAGISDLVVSTPGGVGLFGNDAAMTRILQIIFNEILFHCLAVKDLSRLVKTRELDEILSEDKVNDGKAAWKKTEKGESE